ncbi:MAG TPA: hypothetical protein VNJ02_05285 [Vicinamibacterales bacterium]|nr:hypothetical protein [Vicinamibacterales bacterium]
MALLKAVIRVLLGGALVAIGILHFIRPAAFTSIVPPYLPFPLALVYISGAAEIALGALLQFAATRRLAAWGLIALLIAVFPANVHMWLHPEQFPNLSQTALLIRLPLQLVLIAMVYWVGLARGHSR